MPKPEVYKFVNTRGDIVISTSFGDSVNNDVENSHHHEISPKYAHSQTKCDQVVCRQRQVTVPTVACAQVVEERWALDKSCTFVSAAAFWTSLSFETLEFCIGQVLHYCEIKSITIVKNKSITISIIILITGVSTFLWFSRLWKR